MGANGAESRDLVPVVKLSTAEGKGVGWRARMKVESIFGDVPICKLSAGVVWWGIRCCRIWGQSAPTAEGYLPDQSIVTEPAIK